MESLFLIIVVFLFLLAIFDLFVGVSNDAVNFLNSAIGAKVASFKVILIIASLGVFIGAAFSNGMMEIARHGIFQPDMFTFYELMAILLGVMLTDVILLDVYNSLGLPTSTTVSMVFELLGGTFVLALLKISQSDGVLELGQLLNTDKALAVIIGIFLSVAFAFFFGTVVQYLSRLLFSFNYKKKMSYFIGVFGGIAITAIVYFMLLKGLKSATFMTPDMKKWVLENTWQIVWICLLSFSVLMQILHFLKINVFKVIVLLGTFALAMAFAGNDLVNFIGVPLAGFSSFMEFSQVPGADPHTFMMGALLEPARTPWYFLFAAGLIMVISLATSKKSRDVIKTSLDLSRQEEGEESFGTTAVARSVVRVSSRLGFFLETYTPVGVRKWIDSRFSRTEIAVEKETSFDLVRASVNLVMASILICFGTSMKLPLSTTYVTFMVAMGTSLADRAWNRECAVYRITGVLSVIAGWFLTAGSAFVACGFVTLVLYYGGNVASVLLMLFVVFLLIRSHFKSAKKREAETEDITVSLIVNTHDSDERLKLLRQYTRTQINSWVSKSLELYRKIVLDFANEDLRGIRKVNQRLKEEKDEMKNYKRISAILIHRIDDPAVIEKNVSYYQGTEFCSEILYSLGRVVKPCMEHLDNNFNPLNKEQREEALLLVDKMEDFLLQAEQIILENKFEELTEMIQYSHQMSTLLFQLKKQQLKRIRKEGHGIKVSLVYLVLIQETVNLVTYTINVLKESQKFQQNS